MICYVYTSASMASWWLMLHDEYKKRKRCAFNHQAWVSRSDICCASGGECFMQAASQPPKPAWQPQAAPAAAPPAAPAQAAWQPAAAPAAQPAPVPRAPSWQPQQAPEPQTMFAPAASASSGALPPVATQQVLGMLCRSLLVAPSAGLAIVQGVARHPWLSKLATNSL